MWWGNGVVVADALRAGSAWALETKRERTNG
jgi:hypothetical protein